MPETWLRPNHRVFQLGMILPVVLCAIGLSAILFSSPAVSAAVRIVGWALTAVGVLLGGVVLWQWKTPRLSYDQGHLLVHLRVGKPWPVPVDVVECMFLGNQPGQIPGTAGREIPVRSLVLRLAEKAEEYHRREVKATLGAWEGGYITIHGAWCEPLSVDLIYRLNARLHEVKQTTEKTPV